MQGASVVFKSGRLETSDLKRWKSHMNSAKCIGNPRIN